MRYLLVCSVALAACASEPEPQLGSRQQASSVVMITPATALAADNVAQQAQHYTYTGDGSTNPLGAGWLVVFLPGAGMGTDPSGYDTWLKHADALGFHVIGLSYWDTADYGTARIEDICNISSFTVAQRSACWGDVRNAMWDGSSVPNVSSFNVPDHANVKERLDNVLAYLDDNFSGWSEFRESGHPKWSKIIIAGHSMGAGNAAWIAQHRQVHRLVMMSQPQDYVTAYPFGDVPATWIDDGFGQTQTGAVLSPSNMYGLSHQDDTTSDYARTIYNWSVFGMTGLRCVESGCTNLLCAPSSGQYCGAHRLYGVTTGISAHNAVAQREDLYGNAWTYMLTSGL